jgi:hypothetical protein
VKSKGPSRQGEHPIILITTLGLQGEQPLANGTM